MYSLFRRCARAMTSVNSISLPLKEFRSRTAAFTRRHYTSYQMTFGALHEEIRYLCHYGEWLNEKLFPGTIEKYKKHVQKTWRIQSNEVDTSQYYALQVGLVLKVVVAAHILNKLVKGDVQEAFDYIAPYLTFILTIFGSTLKDNSYRRPPQMLGSLIGGVYFALRSGAFAASGDLAAASQAASIAAVCFCGSLSTLISDMLTIKSDWLKPLVALGTLAAGLAATWYGGYVNFSSGALKNVLIDSVPWLTRSIGIATSSLSDTRSHIARASTIVTGSALTLFNLPISLPMAALSLVGVVLNARAILRNDTFLIAADGRVLNSTGKKLGHYFKTLNPFKPKWQFGITEAELCGTFGFNKEQIAEIQIFDRIKDINLFGGFTGPSLSAFARLMSCHAAPQEMDRIKAALRPVFTEENGLHPGDCQDLLNFVDTNKELLQTSNAGDRIFSTDGRSILIALQGIRQKCLPFICPTFFSTEKTISGINSPGILWARKIKFNPHYLDHVWSCFTRLEKDRESPIDDIGFRPNCLSSRLAWRRAFEMMP